jgi:glutamate-1-semialdehyde 2,1-aminomutase
MAEMITRLLPSVEMVRMVNSGTEATMSVVRVARAATQRDLTLKFEGCYHGHADAFLSKAGSGAATLGIPDSPGVPQAMASTTLTARYNDLENVRALFESHKDRVASVLVEPVVGNMGCVPPAAGFLEGLRALCDEHGTLLIFDEVMTGFRVALGGAQERFHVRPDLTALGKVIGGGLPVGAYGGRRDLMQLVAPAGPVYQAGTLSGNPLAMAAGLATLRHLEAHREIYDRLESLGARLQAGIEQEIRSQDYPATVNRVGSMITLFFSRGRIASWDDAARCDREAFGRYHRAMLEQGFYLPPSQFEAAFVSTAHGDAEIEQTVAQAQAALRG